MTEENPIVRTFAEVGKTLREGAEQTAKQMEILSKILTKKDQ